jgi:hypothetical protein
MKLNLRWLEDGRRTFWEIEAEFRMQSFCNQEHGCLQRQTINQERRLKNWPLIFNFVGLFFLFRLSQFRHQVTFTITMELRSTPVYA